VVETGKTRETRRDNVGDSVVLCYHAVSETWNHLLAVRRVAFERQLRLMLARRYRPASAADIAANRHKRMLHVTFDDAFKSVRNAVPILERLRIPATVFACTAYADGGRVFDVAELAEEAVAHADELATMDWEALAELADHGIEIGSHTKTHAHLCSLSDSELRAELLASREQLEDVLRVPCRFLAFPYGEHDVRVRAAARAIGYQAAFALPGRARPRDLFALPRVGIWRHTGVVRAAVKTSPVHRPVAAIRGWR
jgi:peptidoglycan/xylan/chitin deacetylase (PgdA/CDA1 family)